MWKVLKEVYEPFKWNVLVMFGFVVLQQVLAVASPYYIAKAFVPVVQGGSFWDAQYYVLIAFALYFLQQTVVQFFRERYEVTHGDLRLPAYVNERTWRRILKFSISQHLYSSSGVKQSVIAKGRSAIVELGHLLCYEVIPAASATILLLGVVMWNHFWLGLFLMLGVFGFGAYVTVASRRLGPLAKAWEIREHAHHRFQGDILQNVGLVLTNAQEERIVRESMASMARVQEVSREFLLRYNHIGVGRNFLTNALRFGGLSLAIWFAFRGSLDAAAALAYWTWSSNALGRVENVGNYQRRIISLFSSVKKFVELLSIEPNVKVSANPVRLERIGGEIRFEGVTMAYRPRTATLIEEDEEEDGPAEETLATGRTALDDVTLTIRAGERVAIVGESGAGKTSLIQLLLRAQDPDRGRILIDGHDLRDLDLQDYRESVGVVEQHVPLLDQSLRYNITFGLNGRAEKVTDAELDLVADLAGLSRFKHRLERGYDTRIGERGVKLSGGERQRVGIARAIIKDPSILILDEATSNLDPENEALISEAMDKVSKDRTTIVIAHRYSTIRSAHRIIVLDDGKMVGEGTHATLMRTCDRYRRLVERQLHIDHAAP